MTPCIMPRHKQVANRIKTHLFIISPNNSGSTFLKNVLATCKNTWNLRREGQKTFGFCGPIAGPHSRLIPGPIWAAKQQWIDILLDKNRYNWTKTKKAWYLQAFTKNEASAEVFVEKSPPFLLQVSTLQDRFCNAKFLFLVRNPYAVAEGIFRRVVKLAEKKPPAAIPIKLDEMHELVATHIVTCFQYQKKNKVRFSSTGILFTYEEMCCNSHRISSKIQSLVPALYDLRLDQKIAVKGTYDEPLRNMNQQQIERLTPSDIEKLNRTFRPHEELLNSFGYEIMKT